MGGGGVPRLPPCHFVTFPLSGGTYGVRPSLPCKGRCRPNGRRRGSPFTPLSPAVTFPLCVVASSVSLVSAQGRKARSLPCARRKSPWGTPPSPTEPSSAAVSSFAALRMRHTPCGYLRLGFGGDPIWGLIEVRSCLPCKGRWRPNGRRRGSPFTPLSLRDIPPFRGELMGCAQASPVRGGAARMGGGGVLPEGSPGGVLPEGFPAGVISAQTPFSVRCSSPRFALRRIRSPAVRCGMHRGRSAGIPPEIPKTPARRRSPWAAALPAGG